jgi:hypothetical protein
VFDDFLTFLMCEDKGSGEKLYNLAFFAKLNHVRENVWQCFLE